MSQNSDNVMQCASAMCFILHLHDAVFNNAMYKFLDCVTWAWVELNQVEQRSREKKMFLRRARKYLTMIENMLTVGVCWITRTQKV